MLVGLSLGVIVVAISAGYLTPMQYEMQHVIILEKTPGCAQSLYPSESYLLSVLLMQEILNARVLVSSRETFMILLNITLTLFILYFI